MEWKKGLLIGGVLASFSVFTWVNTASANESWLYELKAELEQELGQQQQQQEQKPEVGQEQQQEQEQEVEIGHQQQQQEQEQEQEIEIGQQEQQQGQQEQEMGQQGQKPEVGTGHHRHSSGREYICIARDERRNHFRAHAGSRFGARLRAERECMNESFYPRSCGIKSCHRVDSGRRWWQ